MPTPLGHPRRRRQTLASIIACASFLALGALLSGCGTSSRTPSLHGLPLASGASIQVDQKVCNGGSAAYCALEMVVRGPSYPNSRALAMAEKALLAKSGWSKVNAPIGLEMAADSPGHRLRVTYAGAGAELQAIDLGWITRSRRISLALSRAIFGRHAAMAVLLETGSGS